METIATSNQNRHYNVGAVTHILSLHTQTWSLYFSDLQVNQVRLRDYKLKRFMYTNTLTNMQ